jgi:3-isopropylmalate/(R)-2-methylmalate dehydratase small subunit
MQTVYRGRIWKFGDSINTDLIQPSRALRGGPPEELRKQCMSANRPGWAEQVRKGDILVAGRNFACGSSRPAPRMLRLVGISCVLAESISRLFLRNAINIGFPALVCPGVSALAQEGDELEVDIETGDVRNLATGNTAQAEGFPADSPPGQILLAGGLRPFLEERLAREGRLRQG